MILLRVDTETRIVSTPLGPLPCTIGRTAARPAGDKREGDGATPLGTWPIEAALLRPDRVPTPTTSLPWRWLRTSDGWSDDPLDPNYNRAVRHPHGFSAEHLWRDDALYDVILVLGHNRRPPISGLGSAIFFHVEPEACSTQGCVAIARDALVRLLPLLAPGDAVEIA